jgi:inner membrane protein
MPSVFSHAIAAVAMGGVAIDGRSRVTMWMLGAVCAVVPDLDVISVWLGVPYRSMLGHRGITHSLFFAAVLASVVTALVRRTLPGSPSAARLWVFFFLATASHGLLDSMTNGGQGVAFLAPFSPARYFFPWQPIVVSPISIHAFFGHRGVRVMWSELGWVWLPAALVFLAGVVWRRRPSTSRRLP